MSSRSPKKRKRATPFNTEITARLTAMGYTTAPRPYGHAPRPLGEPSSSEGEDQDSELESPSKAAKGKGKAEGMTIWEMMRRAEEGAARLDGRVPSREEGGLQESSAEEETDQLDSSEDDSRSHSKKQEKKSKPKKERLRLSVDELRALVERHKERAMEGREEVEEKRRRAEMRRGGPAKGKGKEREWTPMSDAMEVEERKPSWRGRDGTEEDEDGLEIGEDEEDEEESERSRTGSPLKTPSNMLFKLSLASSSKKQLFPSTPSKPFPLPSPSSNRIIPLPPSSPFHKPPPTPRKSPVKPSLALPLSPSSPFANLSIPSFLTSGKAHGARLLRKRVAWILATARSFAADLEKSEGRDARWWSRKVAKELAGCSEEWWRSNAGFEREESELGLDELDEFAVFQEGAEGAEGADPPVARYYSFVLHFKLCGHAEEECRYHRALVLYHSFRVPRGTTGKKLLPKRWDLEEEETRREWTEFESWWVGMAEKLGWGEEGSKSRSESRSKSRSPRKRKIEVKEEGLDDDEFGD
ncbi:hypothetical protein BCR35DRAFT_331745 [Leucosporidium creatinivorum]|uniref:Uncharacterized protein n=1 Tax=Leucosporidium creatinivorum TaxID=106004 RepID=A0A1Y2FAL7_9BASI|nr:hypothetical protein BCR35DRAFT_331745 [Leucosporidium creatinivorum]